MTNPITPSTTFHVLIPPIVGTPMATAMMVATRKPAPIVRTRGTPPFCSEDLNGNLAAQARIPRAVDLAHAAGAERAQDLGATESRALCECQSKEL